jgi:hypothetical protein
VAQRVAVVRSAAVVASVVACVRTIALCGRASDDRCWCSGGDNVIWNVTQHDTPSPDNCVVAYRNPCANGDRRAEPRVFTDDDRGGSFPPFPALAVVIDGVQSGHQLRTGADSGVCTNADGRIVHEEPVGVDEGVRSESNVVPVAALKPRHNERPVIELAKEAGENLRPGVGVVGRRQIEAIELAPAVQTPRSQLVVVEVPLPAG